MTAASADQAYKRCFKCLCEKPLSEFYRHSKMADGRLNKCKKCTKNDVAKHRSENLERIRQYDRERGATEERKAVNRVRSEVWRNEHPDRRSAQVKVGNALRSGLLRRLPCMICGEGAEAHHPDYSRPLDVVWLCSAHHKQAHQIAYAEEKASDQSSESISH